jgi:hypothetical protein
VVTKVEKGKEGRDYVVTAAEAHPVARLELAEHFRVLDPERSRSPPISRTVVPRDLRQSSPKAPLFIPVIAAV